MISTFSIVGADPAQESVGVAVASRFLAVGSVVPVAVANVGALATQAFANTGYGRDAMRMLRRGAHPEKILLQLTREDEQRSQRQVGIVDASGRAAAYTGEDCHRWAGSLTGDGFAVQGNILVGPRTVKAMADAFEESAAESLARRLFRSLEAGEAAGGDRRGKQSAALLVARPGGGYGGMSDMLVDLRVDDHPTPVRELGRLMDLHTLTFIKADPATLIPLEGATARAVLQALKKLGYYRGPVGARPGAAAFRALIKFHHNENFEMRLVSPDRIDPLVLQHLKRMAGR